MKKNFLWTMLAMVGVFAIGSCGGAANNTLTNGNRGQINSAINTASNIGNTVANTVTNTAAKLTTDSPETFLKDAAEGGLTEVELGKLAAANAANAEVKKFGQSMVADHGKANAEVKALAAKKNITLPTSGNKSAIDDLKDLKGAEFDKSFVQTMIDEHEEAVSAFQKQADSGADADVKAFAAKTLPTLKKHLETIKAIKLK